MYRFVLKRNYSELLLSLDHGETSVKECVAKSGITYNHLVTVLRVWENEGIVNRERKETHAYVVTLTDKGKRIVRALRELLEAADTPNDYREPPADDELPKAPTNNSGAADAEEQDGNASNSESDTGGTEEQQAQSEAPAAE